MELEKQLVLTSTSAQFRVNFDQQISVKGARIGLKSIHHPRIYSPSYLSFYVAHVDGGADKVNLPPHIDKYYYSEDLVHAVFEAFKDYVNRKIRTFGNRYGNIPTIEYNDNEDVIHFKGVYKIVRTVEYTFDFIFPKDNVFNVFSDSSIELTNEKLTTSSRMLQERIWYM